MPEVEESAFGKSDKDRKNITASAATGAGSVVAGTGLIAGGIPGAKSDFSGVLRAGDNLAATKGQKGPRKAASTIRGATPALKAIPGGILGFRLSAHHGGHIGFQQDAAAANKKPPKDKVGNFYRGRNEGKIPAEAKVIRGMTRGRHVANAALVGGAAAAAYGHHEKKKALSKRDKKSDTYSATLAGAGATGAAVSHGGAKYLDSHRDRYASEAARHVDEAGKIAPATAGRREKNWSYNKKLKYMSKNPGQPIPKGMHPSISDGAIKQHPEMLDGVTRNAARKVGHLRGLAAQERHFSDVFGSTAKVVRGFRTPSAVVGAVGAGGLLATDTQKKKIHKSTTSAFGVDHG